MLPIVILAWIVTLPYSFYHSSPNWGIRKTDMPPVQLYLDHFSRLHPDLTAGLHSNIERLLPITKKPFLPQSTRYWPNKYHSNTGSTAFTGLFPILEDAGWPRRVVWTFLRDEVEKTAVVTDAQKGEFAHVMEKMCSHHLADYEAKLLHKVFGTWRNKQVRKMVFNLEPLTDLHAVIPVSLDSLDWVLRRGSVVTPNPADVWESYHRLSRLSKFSAIWGWVGQGRTLEEAIGAHWQILDMRLKMSWDESSH